MYFFKEAPSPTGHEGSDLDPKPGPLFSTESTGPASLETTTPVDSAAHDEEIRAAAERIADGGEVVDPDDVLATDVGHTALDAAFRDMWLDDSLPLPDAAAVLPSSTSRLPRIDRSANRQAYMNALLSGDPREISRVKRENNSSNSRVRTWAVNEQHKNLIQDERDKLSNLKDSVVLSKLNRRADYRSISLLNRVAQTSLERQKLRAIERADADTQGVVGKLKLLPRYVKVVGEARKNVLDDRDQIRADAQKEVSAMQVKLIEQKEALSAAKTAQKTNTRTRNRFEARVSSHNISTDWSGSVPVGERVDSLRESRAEAEARMRAEHKKAEMVRFRNEASRAARKRAVERRAKRIPITRAA